VKERERGRDAYFVIVDWDSCKKKVFGERLSKSCVVGKPNLDDCYGSFLESILSDMSALLP
jgi:hypothetical protein